MTQVNCAQPDRNQLAWKPARNVHTLAQRRAQFEAQMREMALSDLQAVADRLKELHKRLEQTTGHKWTEPDIARGANVAHRTYQTWIGAKNENRSGEGYQKLATFYRRKLKDPTITKNWIVWGQEEPPKEEQSNGQTPDLSVVSNGNGPASPSDQILDKLDAIQTELESADAARADILHRLGVIEELLRRDASGGS